MRIVVNFCDEQREFVYRGVINIWGDLIEKIMKFLKITQFEISMIDVGGTQIGHYPNRLSDKVPDDLNQDVLVVNVIARGRDENGRVVPSEFPDLFEIYQIEMEDERLLYGGGGGYQPVQIPIMQHAIPRSNIQGALAPGAGAPVAGMAGFNVMRDAIMDLLVDEMERAAGDQYDEYDDYSDAEVEIPLHTQDEPPGGGPPAFANVLLGAIFAGGGRAEDIRVPVGLQDLLQRLMQGAVGAAVAGQQMSDVKVVCKPEDIGRCICCNYSELSEDTRTKSTTCNVCLEDFTAESAVMQLPDCQHVFHKECIEQWLTTFSHKCPVCRVQLGDGKPLI